MPLEHSSSKDAFKRNVSTLMHEVGNSPHVQSQKQALAIAYATQRRGRAIGGGIANYDAGGSVDPVNAVIQALNAGESTGASGSIGSSNPASPSAAPAASPAATSTGIAPTATTTPAASTPTPTAGVAPGTPIGGVTVTDPGAPATPTPPPANPASFASPSTAATPTPAPSTSTSFAPPTVPSPSIAPAIGGSGFQNQSVVPPPVTSPLNTSGSLLADGGVANRAGGGGFNMASGPAITAPWQERGAARALHVGPVLSNVPGRTDNHQVSVPAGSYVLPAAHMSSMGHGNTNAGMSLASRMFGQGPYGSGPTMKMGGHGGMPHPPKIAVPGPGIANLATGGYTYSEGGAQTGDGYDPVPVDISGGEYVIPPQEIIRRWGNLKNGHAVLDQFVMDERAKEIKTQKALPPPAKE